MAARAKHLSLDLGSVRESTDPHFGLIRTPSFPSSSGVNENTGDLFSKLDKLDDQDVNEQRSSSSGSGYYHIKKTHWVDSKSVTKCCFCQKQFGFSSRKYNCRRCGNVFCDSCCQYRRRLSKDAEPDAAGNLHRVCYHCVELNVQTAGQTRSLTTFYREQRQNKRVNVMHELARLLDGFKTHIKSSRLKSYTTETISLVKVPSWQKSSKWLESSEVEWCFNCSGKFTYLMQKHHCRICGMVVCWKCCLQDLMLFYDDKKTAHWTLIKVVGCPDTEPGVCLYLSVCNPCREEIEELQVQKFYADDVDSGETQCMIEKLEAILRALRVLEERIACSLPRYQELVEGLMDGKKLNDIAGSGENVVQTFAKLYLDLSDIFTEYLVTTQGLKRLKMRTRTEVKVMRSVIDLKVSYYRNNVSLFKSLKDNLNKTLPADALRSVQDYSNKQAINSACIIVKQLGYETLLLADKHQFEPTVAMQLSTLDQVCSHDLEELVTASKENWDEHNNHLKELLKVQLTGHRLVIPPSTSKTRNRSNFVNKFVVDRSLAILTQTLRALEAKSSEKKFAESKEAMKGLLQWLENMREENEKWTIPSR